MALRAISLCTGAAGIELGLHLCVSARTVCYVEREAYAAANLVARMEDSSLDTAPIWDDIKTFDGRAWRGTVDILTAGYPCQPFSNAGHQRGTSDPRHLWPHVARIARESNANILFCENVANHLRIGFSDVGRDLQSMGFRVAAGIYTASEVGAPHRRERVYFLAANPDGVRKLQQERCQPNIWGWTGHSLGSASGPDASSEGLEGLHGEGGPSSRPHHWASEPTPSGVAHGVARRVDRLRIGGNGVVPQVAARAFTELAGVLV